MYVVKSVLSKTIPAGIYLFKVNNANTKTVCGICSKLTKKRFVSLNIFQILFW